MIQYVIVPALCPFAALVAVYLYCWWCDRQKLHSRKKWRGL